MNDDELIHHGVKGMRWGVRKDSYYSVRKARKAYKQTVKELKKSGKANIDNLTKARKEYRDVKLAVKNKIKTVEEELKDEQTRKTIEKDVKDIIGPKKSYDENKKLMDRAIELETENRLMRAEADNRRLSQPTLVRIAKEVAVEVATETAKARSKKALNLVINQMENRNHKLVKKYTNVMKDALKPKD